MVKLISDSNSGFKSNRFTVVVQFGDLIVKGMNTQTYCSYLLDCLWVDTRHFPLEIHLERHRFELGPPRSPV